ncbi:hypothetical protein BpHYR1_041980 [Brachionus plicatilis]|uniref:Uncharacterized protein n=1 Tax=Brachionus plicatilis TaxID=10195 RepID=A0A3M7R4S8_BRAPC|nr:hypothetical protein BpHYR1_041980 [Brachionus plicatilis]
MLNYGRKTNTFTNCDSNVRDARFQLTGIYLRLLLIDCKLRNLNDFEYNLAKTSIKLENTKNCLKGNKKRYKNWITL